MHLPPASRARLRARLIPIVAITLATTFGIRPSHTQTGIDVPQGVLDAVASDGSALVIVGIQRDIVPEGDLASPADIAFQRDSLHADLDDVVARATTAGVVDARRFETIPFFTARVDAAGLAALRAMPGVTSIVEDVAEPPLLAQSVPLVGAPTAWAAGATGAGWKVAVLDTGVQAGHPFFGGRVTHEGCFSDANGAGFTSTSLCPGGSANQIGPGAAIDCELTTSGCGHGTHVAGIAAGANGSGPLAGANGVAPGAQVIAVQVFSRFANAAQCGSNPAPCVLSYTSDQIRGLEYVLAVAGPGNVNRVASANMSLGGGQFFSAAACDASNGPRKRIIDHLRSVGIATVAASGNNGFTSSLSAPACISSAVSVGSTTKADAISSFSNRASFLSLMAPGSAIVSSVPGIGSTAASYNGTSMASPHVAGAWAVLKQSAPGASVSHVLAALQSTGVTIPDGALTHRRIAVDAARTALLATAAGVPGAPGTPVVTGAGNAITISTTPPTSGGVPTNYTILARTSPGGPVVASLPLGLSTSLSLGAPNGLFYVSVQAGNAAGVGPESAPFTLSVPFVPAPPGTPDLISWHGVGNQLRISWSAPSTGGAPTGYTLLAALSPGGTPVAALPVTDTSVAVDNVPPGTYYLRIVASNAGGTGPASAEQTVTFSSTVAAPPQAPVLLPVVVAGGQVTLTWYPSQSGGYASSYTVRAALSSGGPIVVTLPSVATQVTVPAPPGTYYVTVVANNAGGTSAASNQRTVVVP